MNVLQSLARFLERALASSPQPRPFYRCQADWRHHLAQAPDRRVPRTTPEADRRSPHAAQAAEWPPRRRGAR